MPVRSLSSSVLKWPDSDAVDKAVRGWSKKVLQEHPAVLRIGYFGSYARGNWGAGSDVDLIVIVETSDEPFQTRSSKWDATELPVPADVLVYTAREWQSLSREGRFYPAVMQEAVWVYAGEETSST